MYSIIIFITARTMRKIGTKKRLKRVSKVVEYVSNMILYLQYFQLRVSFYLHRYHISRFYTENLTSVHIYSWRMFLIPLWERRELFSSPWQRIWVFLPSQLHRLQLQHRYIYEMNQLVHRTVFSHFVYFSKYGTVLKYWISFDYQTMKWILSIWKTTAGHTWFTSSNDMLI